MALTRVMTLTIGDGGQSFPVVTVDAVGLVDTAVLTRAVTFTDAIGLTDAAVTSSGAGFGQAPFGTAPFGQ